MGYKEIELNFEQIKEMTFVGTGQTRNFGLEQCSSQVTSIFCLDTIVNSQEDETVTNRGVRIQD